MGSGDGADPAGAAGAKIGGGAFIAVVGPSGAGKDTLLNHARQAFADDDRFVFVQRAITRPADGETEDHRPVADADFDAELARGGFAHWWDAHGLKYGVPVSVDEVVRSGRIAICNGSRGALDGLRARYAHFTVISLTARPDVLARRLAGRGRESEAEILQRLERQPDCDAQMVDAVVIENNGAPEDAGRALVDAIEAVSRSVAQIR
ncbi:MAG: ribose 1,5-bisphosphate phosphokinase PhnN [Rhizobiaceae bacterium MnEN-MB40S]|nr:MAG: ribose 1,5-bisphosphate phosphokinase PhnN [Rhizobiaceae bacterium MnEN-MB40S]